ncbi:hypothetical protein C9374_010825 [Naegleria lovaniensis]|uniref:Uncharacterized protein n=1 Tax=Naegleria lovaniensis TaxID=51637 RepID=A0AA88KG07_NAELO|nr:uncharacterized protein C9374_010825 [Naegleria lovaniensis]KAG2374541.1 hypothetical protein C9374_010825 [Naegleria lovaniensis]
MLERAMKSKNPLVLRRCLQNENTAHNSSDRLHTLRQQANTLLDELEREYQLVEDLESLVQSKDMDKILDLREKCQHLRHISAEQVLNECDNLIRQCNESVLYVRNYISGTYCTKKELEDYLRSKTISKQDKMLLRQEWTRSTSKKMMDDLIHDSQLCNILSLQKTIDHTKDFLSDIGEEPHFENKDILLIKLQQAQELMTQLESLKNVLSTEILNDQNLESIKKAIQKASEMNCLEEERTTAQNRVQLFMYARQILDNPRPVLKDVDNILQQAHSWQTLDGTTWKSLCSLKQRLTDEELLKQDIEKALHDKDIFSLQYCRERGKYSNLLEEYRKQIDLVLAQQKHAKEDLLALTKRFVELKHIDEKEYLKFKDVLPEKDINALKEMALKICQQNQEQEQLTNIMENEIKEQIQEHENQLQSLKTILEEKQREKECILESSTSLDLEIQRLNQECESLKQKALEATLKRNHIEQLKLENIRLLQEQHDRIRDTEQQLTHQEDEILVNSKRIEDQVIKIREYEKEHENVQKQMTSLKDEFLSIQANLDIVIKQLQNEKSSMDILREELKHKELEVISQKNEKNTLMECVAQLQKTSNRLNEELSNLLLEKETLRNEEINTRKQLESIQAICAIQLQDIDMLKNEIRRLEKERTNMDLEKEALNLELKNCFESLSAIQNSMELQRHQLEDLREKTHARSTECMELEALIQQEQLALNDKQLSLQEHLKQREKLEELRNSEEQKLTEEIKLCEILHQEVLQLEQIRNEKEEQARVRQQEKYNLEQALKSNLEERFEEENVQITHLKNNLTNLQQLIQKEDEEFKNTQESISMQKESNQSVIQTLKKQLEEEENYLYEVTDLIQKKAQENSVLRNELTLLKEQHLDLETLHREQLAIKEEYQKLDILKRELAQKETEKNQIEVEMEYISQQRKQLESIKTKEMEELKQYQTQLSDKLIAEEMKVKQLEEMIKTKESQKELQTEKLYKRETELLLNWKTNIRSRKKN